MLYVLERDWLNARHLTLDETQELYDEFLAQCVREEYKKRFERWAFCNGADIRSFFRARAMPEKRPIHELLGVAKGKLFSINVLYEAPWDGEGYRVQGREQAFWPIIVMDTTAVMKVTCGKILHYFYYDLAEECLYWVG